MNGSETEAACGKTQQAYNRFTPTNNVGVNIYYVIATKRTGNRVYSNFMGLDTLCKTYSNAAVLEQVLYLTEV